jgi:selenocysteine-specific translation elongation factor
VPLQDESLPFRMIVSSFFESSGGKLKGHILEGQIKGGVLHKESKLVIAPLGVECQVKDFLVNGERRKEALAGDRVEVLIKVLKEEELHLIRAGMLLSSCACQVPVATKIQLELLVLEV